MRIRAARRDDFDAVTALLTQIGRPRLTPFSQADVRAVFDEQVVDPNAHLFLAETDAGVAAFCSLYFRTRLNWPTPEAWVGEFVVVDIARNPRVAEAMLDEAQRRARERDCHALVLESAYRYALEHDLFRAFHMRDLGKYFRLELPVPGGTPPRG